MKPTLLAHTVLAVVAIALAAASSNTPRRGTQTFEKISPDTPHATLLNRPRKTSL
jgi:hypothetical protein